MKGSFTVEASVMVPLVLAVLFLALSEGISMYDESREYAETLGEKERFEIVEVMYRLEWVTDIGDWLNGDAL